jgi:RNA-splicing ligase RtcB
MHLQSIKISPDVNEISENIDVMNKDKSQMILIRISKAFSSNSNKQRYSKRKCEYPIIICGDMTAYSYVYRNIKGTLKDSFEEAGKGFGATYKFKYYPTRIDIFCG